MSQSTVTYELREGVALIQMNRPPVNAMELSLLRDLQLAFRQAHHASAEAIVLSGTGKIFSGGFDLKELASYSVEERATLIQNAETMMAELYLSSIPVVGALNGHTVAGGLAFSMACDYRVGPQGSFKFGLPAVKVGFPFPQTALDVFQAELAPQTFRVLALTGRNFSPEEALAMGLVDELQPAENVVERALEVAKELATHPKDSYARLKQQLRSPNLSNR